MVVGGFARLWTGNGFPWHTFLLPDAVIQNKPKGAASIFEAWPVAFAAQLFDPFEKLVCLLDGKRFRVEILAHPFHDGLMIRM